MQKLNILAIGAHPDDIELTCAATLIKHVRLGDKVGILDLTKGEMGTRGTPEIREQEAEAARKMIGASIRDNLGLRDAFFENDEQSQIKLITKIRAYQPDIILANAIHDRHPDHPRAAVLIKEAVFKSGLQKIETSINGNIQNPWRPKALYHYIQSTPIPPDFIVDVSEVWETKIKAIRAFKSQFFDPKSESVDTYISSPEFLKMIEARGKELGHAIGVAYGEGFTITKVIGVNNLHGLV